ncbi:MAG: sugar ABC transporter permease [Deltaproteobacteria bacterium]|nr:sugar ABC transporter permease [Deltaproteobacteria bacterium]
MSNMAATAAPVVKRTFKQALASESGVKWVYLIPLLVFLSVFMLYPTFYCLVMSFCDYVLKSPPEFCGLENYRDLLQDTDFWQALGRTAYVLVICISVELILGMVFALLLNRNFVGQNIVRGLCFLPLLISPLAMSLMWNYMLHVQFGVVNEFTDWLGLGRFEWFSSKEYALYTIMFISIWQWTPFSIFILLAGLRGMPKDQFEAASVDGARPFFIFRKLTLPMLKPLIIIIILLRTMWLIRIFDPLYGTTRGGMETEILDWMVYRISFVFFDIGRGSAMAMFSLYMTIIVCAIMYRQLIKAMDANA